MFMVNWVYVCYLYYMLFNIFILFIFLCINNISWEGNFVDCLDNFRLFVG